MREYRRTRSNWSRPLPRRLSIPTVMTLRTFADVRELLCHVPPEKRRLDTWQRVAHWLDVAARGGSVEDLSVCLRLVLNLEGVPCHPL
jgi:hypothetical protein